ncbi:MAG: hypothetical protein H6835_02530 [Planctomycetes bacterium]|nr:hypothetical protein [Planctomycetota bacterium]
MLRLRAGLLFSVVGFGVAAGAQNGRVPSDAELAAARPGLVQVLVDRVRRLSGGSPQRAAAELLGAAYEADDDATRYLLWREAVGLAEGAGDLAFARNLEVAFAMQFDLDPTEATVALLLRAADSGDRQRAASAALFGLAAARECAVADDERAMLQLYDAGTRAALACDNAAVFTFVRDRLTTLRNQRDLVHALQAARTVDAERVGGLVEALTQGALPRWSDLTLRQLRPVLEGLERFTPDRTVDSLEPAEWQALAEHAPALELRRALWRCAATAALLRLRRGGRDLPTDEQDLAALHGTLLDLTDRLAVDDGVTRLRFDDAADRERLAFANGDWRVVDGELRGASSGSDNFATHRVRFGALRTVVIRGGIRSADGLNFRCKVGDVNLLLNWEVADENHLWLDGKRFAVQPRLLEPGKEHTVALFAEGTRCDVFIDGRLIWTASLTTQLAGTITVYPALGSEIFVREILIDGDPDGVVDAPSGTLM